MDFLLCSIIHNADSLHKILLSTAGHKYQFQYIYVNFIIIVEVLVTCNHPSSTTPSTPPPSRPTHPRNSEQLVLAWRGECVVLVLISVNIVLVNCIGRCAGVVLMTSPHLSHFPQ